MRKHFYLITEHDEEDRVGGVSVMDSRMSRPTKDNEAPIRVLDDEQEGFVVVGKQVGLGYYDFDGAAEYENNERFAEVAQEKVRSVDREWAKKAGIASSVYDD